MIPPFAPGPGQGILWSLPTITDVVSEQPVGTFASVWTIAADLSSGEMNAIHLSTFASFCAMRWYGFSDVTLPLNTTVAGIYPTFEAMEWDTTGNFNAAFRAAGDAILISGGGGGAAAPGFNGPPPNTSEPAEFGTYFAPSIGTDLSVLATASILAQFYTTIPTSGNGTFRVSLPRMAIYYNAPVIPIGHGANCNDYGPITLEAGSTSAPGNGLLIS
jgi:hypothetical protein